MKNAYIHIPFCKQKCKYCSFISYPKLDLIQDYLKALKKEIEQNYKGEYLETLYIGGGTPSLLNYNEIKDLVNLFNIDKNTEITMEFNPETVITERYPINRISFGCQTFDDEILKFIGRRHKSGDVEIAVNSAKNFGIENINLDFIYGLPNQTLPMFEIDLHKAISLGIQHISLYGLKLDENCYFYKNLPQNLPDNDLQADMYLKAVEILTNAGFEHYEISNFAKLKYKSKHNLNYWNNNNYYGFGVASHGYEGDLRYFNTSSIEKYIHNPTEHEEIHEVSFDEKLEEEIFLGFRKIEGINVCDINEKFDIDFNNRYKSILNKYNNYFIKTDKGYKLTLEGILLSNVILSEFIEINE